MENNKQNATLFIYQWVDENVVPDDTGKLSDMLIAYGNKLNIPAVSGSCSCGVKYVETKKSDIPYDTDDNVYYTDIMIYHCPKCGNIDRIEEY